MMTRSKWQRFAAICAGDAHMNWFHSRRGIWYFEDHDVLVLYNNSPYGAGPHLRQRELAEFRKMMTTAGIKELAFATYPEDGYSYAMVINASRDREPLVAKLMQEAIIRTLASLDE